MPAEFQIIRDYFQRNSHAEELVLGIGDDGAILRPRAGFDQVVVTDTIVQGRHFPFDHAAEDIGWRALAVNLSDIAAMGASPRFAFLNITLNDAGEDWLHAFASGFFALADASGTVLAGGDTTQGPLSVTVTVLGDVASGHALRRGGARSGDLLCVSGNPGEAAAGLERLQAGSTIEDALVRRFCRPEPRLRLAKLLAGCASAAIDISDGLLADLAHILDASGNGARIDVDALPVSGALIDYAGDRARDYVLAGGDDYELCFCISRDGFEALPFDAAGCAISVIGEILPGSELELVDADGNLYVPARRGWEHFPGEQQE